MNQSENEVLDRNLERVIRKGALPMRVARRDQARAEFLQRASAPPKVQPEAGRLPALAAAFLAGAIVVWSMAPSRAPEDASSSPPATTAPESKAGEPVGAEAVAGDEDVSLKVRSTAWTGRPPWVHVKGKVPVEDGTALHVVFQRIEESLVDGRLVAGPGVARSSTRVQVRSGRFDARFNGELGPQEVKLLDIEGPGPSRRWTLRIHLSGPGFEERLTRDFEETVRLVRRARTLIEDFEEACVNRVIWQAKRRSLEKRVGTLKAVLQQAGLRTLCAATIREIMDSIGLIDGSTSEFTWDGEELKVPNYYEKGKESLTHRREKFAFSTFLRYMDEARVLAGREALLCVLREMREGRRLDSRLETLILRIGKESGVEDPSEALRTPEADLAAIEKALREGK